MAHSRLYFLVLIGLQLGCTDELDLSASSLEKNRTRIENLLNRNWRYEYLMVDNVVYTAVQFGTIEPSEFPLIEEMELVRRRINYDDHHTYMINWIEFGEYTLGDSQPPEGAWQLNEDHSGIIHNPGRWYEVEYEIVELSEVGFLRKSIRRMGSNAPDHSWSEGQEKVFYEYLVPVD